jgi:hypothetical protein
MKSGKSAIKSAKQKILRKDQSGKILPNFQQGETLIPTGAIDISISLPETKGNSFYYTLLNTEGFTGKATATCQGSNAIKGLVLNTQNGTLSIDPIPVDAGSLDLETSTSDGSFVNFLSHGNDWFVWSIATGGTIGIGGNPGIAVGLPPTVNPSYADVIISSFTSNTTFPVSSLTAVHELNFVGTAEPNSTIEIVETNSLVQTFTITVDSNGDWSTTISNLPSNSYEFTFTATKIGLGQVGISASEIFASNAGSIIFNTPTSFSPEPGESVNFSTGVLVKDPVGNPITPTIDSSEYNTGLAHGATFDIIYSFTYNAVSYSRTIPGTVTDVTPPAKPIISTAQFHAVNITEFTTTGTAQANSTVKIYKDATLLGTVTANGGGAWTFTTNLTFNSSFDLTVQASDVAGNSPLSDVTSVTFTPPTLGQPTLAVTAEVNGTYTNTANPFTVTGTTTAGATIALFNGSTQITPVSGPSVDGSGNYTATINATNESINSLTAKATKTSFMASQASTPFSLNVDRVAPVQSLVGPASPTIYLGDIGTNHDTGATATDFSSVTTLSNWSTQVTATEGSKTVTYTSTDQAGNQSTITRTVTVTTQVIIPVISSVTDNGNGTVTVVGTVTGSNADNLTVQVLVDGSNNGSPVAVSSGAFTYTTTSLSTGSRSITAKSINSAAGESGQSIAETLTISAPATPPVITITNDAGGADITNTTVNINEGDSFSFTASTNDGSAVTPGGDTLDVNAPATYNLTFDSSNGAGAATQKTLQVVVAAVDAFTIKQLINLTGTSTSVLENYTLGDAFWKSGDTVPTSNAVKFIPANISATYDAEYAKFKNSLNIASMSVGQTYYVEWRRGRNTTRPAGVGSPSNALNLSLIDFSALETLYGTTLSNSWTPANNGTNAVLHTRHQSELVYRLREDQGTHGSNDTKQAASFLERTDATNDTERQDVSTSFTSHTINGYSWSPAEFEKLHRFTVKKTASGFDLGLDVHNGSSWVVKVGSGGSISSEISVTSLPDTLNVVVFNDQDIHNRAAGGVLPFIDITITLS